jgi:hypothetical protein
MVRLTISAGSVLLGGRMVVQDRVGGLRVSVGGMLDQKFLAAST